MLGLLLLRGSGRDYYGVDSARVKKTLIFFLLSDYSIPFSCRGLFFLF